jgi:hypothetical protein
MPSPLTADIIFPSRIIKVIHKTIFLDKTLHRMGLWHARGKTRLLCIFTAMQIIRPWLRRRPWDMCLWLPALRLPSAGVNFGRTCHAHADLHACMYLHHTSCMEARFKHKRGRGNLCTVPHMRLPDGNLIPIDTSYGQDCAKKIK